MPIVKHDCDTCDSKFSINYDDMECEDAPHYCPFCGEYLIEEFDIEPEDD